MHKSSLIDTLKSFSKQDIKEFGLFIGSPFFNTNQSVVKLYNEMIKVHPGYEKGKIRKELLFEKAFGESEYNDNFMRTTIFRLQSLVKEYFIHINLGKTRDRKNMHYLSELKDRELIKQLDVNIINSEKLIEAVKYKDMEYFLTSFELNELKSYVYINQEKHTNLQKFLDNYSEKEEVFTSLIVLSYVFATNLYFLNEQFITKNKSNLYFLQEAITFVEKHSFTLTYPIINVWYNLSILYLKLEDKYFFSTKEIILKEYENFRPFFLFNALINLSTFCHFRIKQGSEIFLREKFIIINLLINSGLYSVYPGNDKLDYWGFNDAVTISLQLNEIEWCENFIKAHKDRLNEETRKQAIHKSYLKLYYHKKQFDRALEELSKLEYYDKPDKVFIKIYSLRLYFELGLTEQAFTELDNSLHLLKNDRDLPEIHKDSFKRFLKYYKLLIGKKFLLKKTDSAKIKKELANEKMEFELRTWFVNKFEE